MIDYLKAKKYLEPRPDIFHDEEAGVLDLSWHTADGSWAIIEIGDNPMSDFYFMARGINGRIKMKGTSNQENLDVIIDFATELMKD